SQPACQAVRGRWGASVIAGNAVRAHHARKVRGGAPARRSHEGQPLMDDDSPLSPALQATLDAFLLFVRVECGMSANTLDAYRRDVRTLFEDLAQSGIDAAERATPHHLADHLGR